MLSLIADIENCATRQKSLTQSNVAQAILPYLQAPCEDLLRDKDDLIRASTALRRLMTTYALSEFGIAGPTDKQILAGVSKPDVPTIDIKTSGTTGTPFIHKYWRDAYLTIERDKHYKLVASELGVTDGADILCMCHRGDGALHAVGYKGINVMMSSDYKSKGLAGQVLFGHGLQNTHTHFIDYPTAAFGINPLAFCEFVVKYVRDKMINLLYINGNFTYILNHYLQHVDDNMPLIEVVSTTCEMADHDSLRELQSRGSIRRWCDHMRCWDGGVTFFTCLYGTAHLMDHLSHAHTDDGKLRCTDFASIVTPFVDYWNGDHATVDDEYKLCECGRWYRPFEFDNRYSRKHMTFQKTDLEALGFEPTADIKLRFSKTHMAFEGLGDVLEESVAPSSLAYGIIKQHQQLFGLKLTDGTMSTETAIPTSGFKFKLSTLSPIPQHVYLFAYDTEWFDHGDENNPALMEMARSQFGIPLGLIVCTNCRIRAIITGSMFSVCNQHVGLLYLKDRNNDFYLDIWGHGQEPLASAYVDILTPDHKTMPFDHANPLTYDGANVIIGAKYKAAVFFE